MYVRQVDRVPCDSHPAHDILSSPLPLPWAAAQGGLRRQQGNTKDPTDDEMSI